MNFAGYQNFLYFTWEVVGNDQTKAKNIIRNVFIIFMPLRFICMLAKLAGRHPSCLK